MLDETVTRFYTVYHHPRDEKGRVERDRDPAPAVPFEAGFRMAWKLRLLPDWLVDRKWAEFQAAQPPQ